MSSEFTILIADLNSRVREFLKREMTEEGFRVLQAETGRDVVVFEMLKKKNDNRYLKDVIYF